MLTIGAIILNWKTTLEILILWFVIYRIMLFFQGTRALQVLRGIIILVFAFFIVQILRLETLDWLLTHLFGISIIGFLIIFQPEIRQGLARLGQQNVFIPVIPEKEVDAMIGEIVKAVDILSKQRVGALIALEKEESLKEYVETGVTIDSKVSAEMLQTIFTPNSLLHDGGVVIQQGRVVAAGCLFPLTEKQDLSRVFGTRHRAAIGLAEQTDAVVVAVSEETGDISMCHGGRLMRDMSTDDLFKHFKSYFKPKKNDKSVRINRRKS